MADAPLNPDPRRSAGGGIGPIDLDASSEGSDDSEETFEEPRFLCTPRGRLLTLFCVLVLAAVGIALGVTQPWNQGTKPSSAGGSSDVGVSDDSGGGSVKSGVTCVQIISDAKRDGMSPQDIRDMCGFAVSNVQDGVGSSAALTVGDLCREWCGECVSNCSDSVDVFEMAVPGSDPISGMTCAQIPASPGVKDDYCDREVTSSSTLQTVGDLCRSTCGKCGDEGVGGGSSNTASCPDDAVDSTASFDVAGPPGSEPITGTSCWQIAANSENKQELCDRDITSTLSPQTVGDFCPSTCCDEGVGGGSSTTAGCSDSSATFDMTVPGSQFTPGPGGGPDYSPVPTPKPTYWWQKQKSTPPPTPAPIDGGQNPASQPSWGTPAPAPNDISTAAPMPPPTPSPTRSPVSAEEFEKYRQMVNAILTAKVSPLGSFSSSAAVAAASDASTPQQSALNWLAFDDPLGLDAASDPAMRIVQRYSAAVLYYGTAGDKWKNASDWLGEKHECDWIGVKCEVKQILAHSEPQVQVTVEERMVTELNLNGNNLFGLIPREIGAFRWLDTLGMYSNTLGGALPTTIGNLTKLERLWLDDCYFQGTIPTELGNLVALKQVDIFRNNFNGQLPTQMGNLGNLTRFSVYDNKLTGTLPTEVGNMKKLKELFLDTNEIGGPIPGQLGGAAELQDLRIYQNKFSGAIPAGLSGLSNLRIFYADNNDLTGQIPATAVAGWTSLVDFQAFKNEIGGSLPEIFGALPDLSVIALADNEIGGVLPPGICQQGSKLLKLDLSGNSLDGSIPKSIKDCSLLQRLHLDNNEMDSSIPTEIGQLSQLKSLHLNDNSFQGSIPSQLKDLASLEELHLESNVLVGSVPVEMCGKLQSVQADCAGVNKEVVCSCCTLCCGQSGCLAPQVVPQLPARAFVP